MGKVQMAAQPEMENLLASIKKAIHDETGSAVMPSASPSLAEGMVFAGSMREMRVRASDEQTLPPQPMSGEVLDLRNKIASQLAPREQPAAAIATPPRPSGFAGLLGGAPRPVEPPQIRRLADPIREKALPPTPRGTAGSLNEQDYPTLEPRDLPRHAPRETWERPTQEFLPAPDVAPARSGNRALAEPTMLASEATAAAASAAFGRLGESLLTRALNDRPIEDLTRDLLRGMLKQWLDENLPDMVERLVREEIARVARRGGR
jgi:cell pole-organizing protein PopZ